MYCFDQYGSRQRSANQQQSELHLNLFPSIEFNLIEECFLNSLLLLLLYCYFLILSGVLKMNEWWEEQDKMLLKYHWQNTRRKKHSKF